ncbi:MAG: hypothetical protein ABIJ47_09180 [Candidatus Bathyarchaeota archaeon]
MINDKINYSQYDLIEKTIIKFLSKKCASFEAIFKKCYGLYPLDLKQILHKLENDGKIIRLSNSKYTLIEKKKNTNYIRSINHKKLILPKPHLYDFDWRFTESTISSISKNILADISETDVILLLGAPSILAELLLYEPTPNVILIDNNRSVIDFFKKNVTSSNVSVYRKNLLQDKWNSTRKIEKVFFDAPWYLEHYIAFLCQASLVTNIGSTLESTLYSLNTRPEAYSERNRIIEVSQLLGFSLESIEKNVINYKTPDFEKSSLKSAGINLIKDWRTADLVKMIKYKQVKNEKINQIMNSIVKNNEKNEWHDFYHKKHKIMIKGPFDDYNVRPKLIRIEKNDVLSSVSRKYDKRSVVDLWISDNRVYKIEGKSSFLHALLILSKKNIPLKLMKNTQQHIDEALSYLNDMLS